MASPTQWTRQQKFSRGIWAVAFAAIVVVGSLTGAQLKSDEQKTEVRISLRPVPPPLLSAISMTYPVLTIGQQIDD